VNVLPIFLAMGFAWAFGKRFRVFSLVALGTAFAFGAVASMQAGQLDANEPTPWHGVYERINIGAYLLWMAILAVMIYRTRRESRETLTGWMAGARWSGHPAISALVVNGAPSRLSG
jgi:hypothetical protein